MGERDLQGYHDGGLSKHVLMQTREQGVLPMQNLKRKEFSLIT